ncbi:MAG: PAAR domain-containing protein [Pseudomonadaceae bacterium]|nr:PAAR domain-containing protein [Pseudomonadaceae bacterium]
MSGKPAARVSDINNCPLPGHGPNPITAGSPNVLFNNLPVARIGDATGCGDVISVGIPNILINGKPIAFLGSATAHGGVIISGSGDVLVGNQGGGVAFTPASLLEQLKLTPTWVSFDLLNQSGAAYSNEPYVLTASDGANHKGQLDNNGFARIEGIQRGTCKLQFPGLGITRTL